MCALEYNPQLTRSIRYEIYTHTYLGCDPNDLPVEIDSLAVYNLPDEEMRGEVQGILKGTRL